MGGERGMEGGRTKGREQQEVGGGLQQAIHKGENMENGGKEGLAGVEAYEGLLGAGGMVAKSTQGIECWTIHALLWSA